MSKIYKAGIVGLPNVGKSSLFNFLTNSNQAKSENFPFCTIDPNKAMVQFKDKRVNNLASIVQSKKCIYSFMEIVDIAGLVEGASNGEGLGNQFLSHIREVNAIVHLVRCFSNDDIIHVKDNVDPIRDLEIIFNELRVADLETIDKMKKKASKDPELLNKLVTIENKILNEEFINEQDFPLLCCKPFLVLGNGNDNNIEHINKISEYCKNKSIKFIYFDISEQNKENIDILLKNLFDLLNVEFFFTVGPEEARSWSIQKNTNAKDAAGEIHTSISDKFIKAEVYNINEIVGGSIKNIRKRQEGKDYIVKDGDIILFKHNA